MDFELLALRLNRNQLELIVKLSELILKAPRLRFQRGIVASTNRKIAGGGAKPDNSTRNLTNRCVSFSATVKNRGD